MLKSANQSNCACGILQTAVSDLQQSVALHETVLLALTKDAEALANASKREAAPARTKERDAARHSAKRPFRLSETPRRE